MPLDASDETQLLGATAQGRCIFTFNIRDFLVLAKRYPQHSGIILAAQSSWKLSDLIAAQDRLLKETQAADWTGQVRWLTIDCKLTLDWLQSAWQVSAIAKH